jgi:hypothetical protein
VQKASGGRLVGAGAWGVAAAPHRVGRVRQQEDEEGQAGARREGARPLEQPHATRHRADRRRRVGRRAGCGRARGVSAGEERGGGAAGRTRVARPNPPWWVG